MTTLTLEKEPQAVQAESTQTHLIVHLDDGRALSVPLEWFPRLAYATPQERANCQIEMDGNALHWPDLDEDLHVPGLLEGRRSAESAGSLERWKAVLDEQRRVKSGH